MFLSNYNPLNHLSTNTLGMRYPFRPLCPRHADAVRTHALLNFQQHRDQFPRRIVRSDHAQRVGIAKSAELLLREILAGMAVTT